MSLLSYTLAVCGFFIIISQYVQAFPEQILVEYRARNNHIVDPFCKPCETKDCETGSTCEFGYFHDRCGNLHCSKRPDAPCDNILNRCADGLHCKCNFCHGCIWIKNFKLCNERELDNNCMIIGHALPNELTYKSMIV